MTNDQMTKNKYDLEERTAKFGEEVIKFAKKIPVNLVTKPLIPQLVSAGTSIGANYCEAIVKQMMLNQGKILNIRSEFAKRRQEKPNIG